MTRLICALFAIGGIAMVVVEVVTVLRIGRLPAPGEVVGGVGILGGIYLFGYYAIRGAGRTDSGVMSEPSDEVRILATRPGSKVEAIKAYREQTGVDVRRAKEVVERLAARR